MVMQSKFSNVVDHSSLQNLRSILLFFFELGEFDAKINTITYVGSTMQPKWDPHLCNHGRHHVDFILGLLETLSYYFMFIFYFLLLDLGI